MPSISEAIPSFGAATLEGFDTNGVQPGQRVPGIKRQLVKFYWKKEPQVYATEVQIDPKTGSTKVLKTAVRDVTREMVTILTPGDNNNIVDDYADDFHKREHWREYRAFREGKTGPIGKDIDECNYVPPQMATELRILGVHTEEQLADASDLLCGRVANGYELREFARSMCKANLENKSLHQVTALKQELAKSQETAAAMQKQLDEMRGMIVDSKGEPMTSAAPVVEESISEPRRSPGRPKKITEGHESGVI